MCFAINAHKVLILAPFNGKSHFLYIQTFVLSLLERGHETTLLTSHSMSHLKLKNYTEILIDPPFDIYSLCKCQMYEFHDIQWLSFDLFVRFYFSSTGIIIENERQFYFHCNWSNSRICKYDEQIRFWKCQRPKIYTQHRISIWCDHQWRILRR